MTSKINVKKIAKFLFYYQKPHLFIGVLAGILMIINVLLATPMPLITKYFIDTIIPSKNYNMLNFICVVLLGVIITMQITGYFMKVFFAKYKARVSLDLERDLYMHIQELPLNYFSNTDSGYIMGRISELGSAETFMLDTFFRIFKNIIVLLVGSVIILKLNLELGIISLAILPFFIYAVKHFHKKIKTENINLKEAKSIYMGKLERNLNLIEKIKSEVVEINEGKKIQNKLKVIKNQKIRVAKIQSISSSVSSFIGLIAPFIVLWYGGTAIIKGNLTLGTFFAINSFIAFIYSPARSLSEVGYTFSKALSGIERVLEILNEIEEKGGGVILSEINDIEFNNVTFSYEDRNILNGLNIKIKKGEKIALIGKSGEGKSTILKLLLKFYEIEKGRIKISGIDIDKLERKNLRKKIAYVPQIQFLLGEDINEERNLEQLSNIWEELGLNFSLFNLKKYHKKFSGGEAQRFNIVEACMKQADLVLFDEGISHVDYLTEKKVIKVLLEKFNEKTIIFIAHRLDSMKYFDRILILENGRIEEEGTHEELLRKNGIYTSFWK